MKKSSFALFLGLILVSASSNAANISSLSEDFDNTGFTESQYDFNGFDKFEVVNKHGSVDLLIDDAYVPSCHSGNGCIDLDGTKPNGAKKYEAGEFQTKDGFIAGIYSLEFALSGNQRPESWHGASDTVTVTFGSFTQEFTLANTADWATFSFTDIVVAEGDKLTFTHTGGDTGGITLDSIQVSAVPVPAAVWLFGSGLLGLVGYSRRKAA